MRSGPDQQWSRFVLHARVPFHITEDPELDEFLIMYEHYIVAGLEMGALLIARKLGSRLTLNMRH